MNKIASVIGTILGAMIMLAVLAVAGEIVNRIFDAIRPIVVFSLIVLFHLGVLASAVYAVKKIGECDWSSVVVGLIGVGVFSSYAGTYFWSKL